MVKQKINAVVDLLFLLILASIFIGSDSEESINLCTNSEVGYENYNETKTDICGCEQRHSCVRKCCQSGFHHFHNESPYHGFFISTCIKKNNTNFTVPIYDGLRQVYVEDKFMVGMLDCKNEGWQYFKMSNADRRQKFYIQKNGSLFYPFYNKMYNNDRYCVDEQEGLTAYLCFSPRNTVSHGERVIYVLVKVAPLPFLLITFVVYAILPEPSLHGRALMRHVLSLIFANSCVAVVQYHMIHGNILCQVLGYSIILFMLASFFWMNVMCIDIWLAFSALRGQVNLEKKLFLLCYIYAWGAPLIIISVIFLINTYGDQESPLYPAVGNPSCFINGYLQTFLYYFSPILVLVVVNTTLFILTTMNIRKVKKETSVLKNADSRRHTSNEDNRKKFSLYWKLLFAMGINPVINVHVLQAVSWAVGLTLDYDTANYIFYIKDLAHILYGIFIFITYVCKKNIRKDLKKRYFVFTRKSILTNYTPKSAISSLSISEGVNGNTINSTIDKKEEMV